MLRFLDPANAISLVGLSAAVAAMLLAAQGHLAFAVACLMGCGLCDVFDGLVARKLVRTEEEKVFGQRLDSLVDACAFGMTPPLIFYAAGARTAGEMSLLGLFAACAVWRLAFFDTRGYVEPAEPPASPAGAEEPGSKPPLRYYTGLPTTFTSIAVPTLFLTGLHSAQALRITADVAAGGLAIAMVTPFPFPKPRGLAYPVLSLVALSLLGAYVAIGLRGGYPAP